MNDNINEVFELIDNIDTVVFESYMNVVDAINSTYDKQILIMENTDTDTSEFTIFQEEFYQEAVSKKEQRRMDNFLKRHNYDPKTKTIETDIKDKNGKKRRVHFNISDELMYGSASSLHNLETNTVEDDTITMTRQILKRKPHISNGMFKHEEGHIAYKTGNINKNSSFMDNLKSAKQRIDNSKRDLHEHDKDPEEYAVDAYAAEHTKKGIEGMRRALQAMKSSDVKMKIVTKRLIFITNQAVDSSYNFKYLDSLISHLKTMLDGTKYRIALLKKNVEYAFSDEDEKSAEKELRSWVKLAEQEQKQLDAFEKIYESKDIDAFKRAVDIIRNEEIDKVKDLLRRADNGFEERRAFLNSLKYKK